jgi:hypothetical protein
MGTQVRLPITVAVGTISVIGRLNLVSCEAWHDETLLLYQEAIAIDSGPYGSGVPSLLACGITGASSENRIKNL